MPRDIRAYLADALEACDAISRAVEELDFQAYQDTRLIRSSVEREFITIGEALLALHRLSAQTFASITQSRRIVDFRNQLTHQYSTVDDAIVWAIIEHDVPVLCRECFELLHRLDSEYEDSDEGSE